MGTVSAAFETPTIDVVDLAVTADKPSKTARPKSCGQLYLVSPDLAAEGCKRLPRHHGDHRATLHAAPKPKASAAAKSSPKGSRKPTRKLSPRGKAASAFKAELAALVESGSLTASDAMSKFAARIA